MENQEQEKKIWTCTARCFLANRWFQVGDQISASKSPSPIFRPFNPEIDRKQMGIMDLDSWKAESQKFDNGRN